MKEIDEAINNVIAQWNPIDVPCSIKNQEYIDYIPLIKKNIKNKYLLRLCLKRIVYQHLGFESNSFWEKDIKSICNELYKLRRRS